MKRILTILAISLSLSAFAQEGPLISSAVIAIDRTNDLAEAKKYISEAAEIINTKDKSNIKYKDLRKFYYYRGLINYRIAASEKPQIQALDTNALDKAAEAFQNVIEYEASIGKESYTEEAKQQLPYVANLYAQRGINESQKKNYTQAYEDFLKTYEMKKKIGAGTDTTMLYNAALMAQNAGNYAKALDILSQLIDMGYKGVTYKAVNAETGEVVEFPTKNQMELALKSESFTDGRVEGDMRPELYVAAANLHLQTGDTTQYEQMVTEGRKMFPKNEALLRAELQKFLETKQYDKAMVNLNQAISQNPENKLFYYIKGYIMQTSMDSVEGARKAYKEAIAVDSSYLEPMYMMGLTYVDEANAYSEKMNALPLNATEKYGKLKKAQEEAFRSALPYFKKARKISPQDLDTLNALKEVYYKLKMREEAMEVQAAIDKLQ